MQMKKESLGILMIIGIFMLIVNVSAAINSSFYNDGLGSTLCATAEVTDISPTSIGIGEEFTVGIQIEGCGTQIPENVSFEITALPTDIGVKEPLKTEISKFSYSSSQRFLLYHMKAANDAKPGTYIIKTILHYGGEGVSLTKQQEITINIIGDEAEINIASVKTNPILPMPGEVVELTLRIENFGDGSANSLKISANHPFNGIKESFMGTLDSNEDGPAVFTFIPDMYGEFNVPVSVSYKDDFGEKEFNTSVNIVIINQEIDYLKIVFWIVALIIIVFLSFYFIKMKKEKNKIIQQLLKGNHDFEEIKKSIKNKK